MLKIKDNVDLKELEKYGFKRIRYINDISEEEWKRIFLIQDESGNIRKKTDEDIFPEEDVNLVIWEKRKPNKTDFSYDWFWICEYDNSSDDDEKMKNREIQPEDVDIDILYDLIQDDLVEKV